MTLPGTCSGACRDRTWDFLEYQASMPERAHGWCWRNQRAIESAHPCRHGYAIVGSCCLPGKLGRAWQGVLRVIAHQFRRLWPRVPARPPVRRAVAQAHLPDGRPVAGRLEHAHGVPALAVQLAGVWRRTCGAIGVAGEGPTPNRTLRCAGGVVLGRRLSARAWGPKECWHRAGGDRRAATFRRPGWQG